jgi:hypothetical protein
MTAIKAILAGGVVAAALVSAAPASAQYYPGYGNPIGTIINQVLGGGAGGYGYGGGGYGYGGYGGQGYGVNSQAAVSQCVGAVQARLNGGYGGYSPYGYNSGYGYNGPYGGYGNNAVGQGRVLGISRIEPRSSGGLTIRGVATSGHYAGYGYGGGYGAYGAQAPVDLTFKCKTDYRGFITDVDVDRAQSNYGYNYTPYNNDYSQYGYRRY